MSMFQRTVAKSGTVLTVQVQSIHSREVQPLSEIGFLSFLRCINMLRRFYKSGTLKMGFLDAKALSKQIDDSTE
jgi:hypothetical protein